MTAFTPNAPTPPINVSPNSVAGGLWLQAAVDNRGQTKITQQRHAAPIHVSKPYQEGKALLLQTVSPTAGLLAGDRLTVDVTLNQGAQLTLYNPTVTRVHSMKPSEAQATCTQRFCLNGENTFLEFINEGTLLQNKASFEQHTHIHLNQNAEMIFFDKVWPGRIASGEAFCFTKIKSSFQAFRNGKPIAIERSHITPTNRSGRSWRKALGASIMTTFYVLTEKDLSEFTARINALQPESDCWMGATTLETGGLLIRVLSASTIHLRALRHAIRALLSASLKRELLTLRTL